MADFVPAVLAGIRRPAAHPALGVRGGAQSALFRPVGRPAVEGILGRLDARLAGLRERLYERAYAADRPAGHLSAACARTFRLREGIPIAMGAFDAHYGAVGAGIRTGTLVKIIGTSTCDCAIAPAHAPMADIPGICGIVNGSIMPGYYGIEAGQSAVGDILKWWVEVVCEGTNRSTTRCPPMPSACGPARRASWPSTGNNGNRTILVDPHLTGLIVGQTLHTSRGRSIGR